MAGKAVLMLVMVSTLSSCALVKKPSKDELLLMENPPPLVEEKINRLLPKALAWYTAEERKLLSEGRPLTDREKRFARKVGVAQVDIIRVIVAKDFPMPADEMLLREAMKYGFGSTHEGGRTMGHAVLVKPQYKSDSEVISHELIHVSQIERLGMEQFIRRYIAEMEIVGYSRSPLELEAYEKQSLLEQ